MIVSVIVLAVLAAFGGLVAMLMRAAKTNGLAEATHESTMERIDDLLETKRQDDIVNSNPDVVGMSKKLSDALREG